MVSPASSRLRLAVRGAPHLSTIESIGTPSDIDSSSSAQTTPLDVDKEDDGSEGVDSSAEASAGYFSLSDLSANAHLHDGQFMSPRSVPGSPSRPRHMRQADTKRLSAGSEERTQLDTASRANRTSTIANGSNGFRRSLSVSLGTMHSGKRKGTNAPHYPASGHASRGQGDPDANQTASPASDDSLDLWGTPVDADAIAMGLVTVPDDQATSGRQRDNKLQGSHSGSPTVRRTASIASMRTTRSHGAAAKSPPHQPLRLKNKQSLPNLGRHRANRSGGKIASPGQDTKCQATASEVELDVDILASAGLSLESSADPFYEVRERCLSDIRLLLSKSIQRGCDGCKDPQALGLWVWTWTSQCLCTPCVSLAAQGVSVGLKETLIERTRALRGPDSMAVGNIKEVDTQMLASVANELPSEAIKKLDLVNRKHRIEKHPAPLPQDLTETESSPTTALGLELGVDSGEDHRQSSFMRVDSPPLAVSKSSTPWNRSVLGGGRVGRGFHSSPANGRAFGKALRKLAKRSMPRLHAMTSGSSSATAPAFLLPDVPAHALARLPSMAPASPKSAKQSSPAIDASFLSPSSSYKTGFSSSSSSSSEDDSRYSREYQAASMFLNGSSIFVGILSVRRSNDYQVLLDEVFLCSACPPCSAHHKGSVVLASTLAEHSHKYHQDMDKRQQQEALMAFHVDWQGRDKSSAAVLSVRDPSVNSEEDDGLSSTRTLYKALDGSTHSSTTSLTRYPSANATPRLGAFKQPQGSPELKAAEEWDQSSSTRSASKLVGLLGMPVDESLSPTASRNIDDLSMDDADDVVAEEALAHLLTTEPPHKYLQAASERGQQEADSDATVDSLVGGIVDCYEADDKAASRDDSSDLEGTTESAEEQDDVADDKDFLPSGNDPDDEED